MKAVIAIDSFKGSVSSMEAGNAAKEAVLSVYPEAEVIVMPLADGGEGTVETLACGMGGEMIYTEVTGPLGDKIQASYGITGIPRNGDGFVIGTAPCAYRKKKSVLYYFIRGRRHDKGRNKKRLSRVYNRYRRQRHKRRRCGNVTISGLQLF